jgi:hypothetical protein
LARNLLYVAGYSPSSQAGASKNFSPSFPDLKHYADPDDNVTERGPAMGEQLFFAFSFKIFSML